MPPMPVPSPDAPTKVLLQSTSNPALVQLAARGLHKFVRRPGPMIYGGIAFIFLVSAFLLLVREQIVTSIQHYNVTGGAALEPLAVSDRMNRLIAAITNCAVGESQAIAEADQAVDMSFSGLQLRQGQTVEVILSERGRLLELAKSLEAAAPLDRPAICRSALVTLAALNRSLQTALHNDIRNRHAQLRVHVDRLSTFSLYALTLLPAVTIFAYVVFMLGARREIRNIFEVQESQRQVREMQETQKEFLGLASHELNSPIHSLQMLMSSIRRAGGLDVGDDLWNSLENVGNLLKDRAGDITDFVHLKSGKMVPRLAPFIPHAVISSVLMELEGDLIERDLNVEWLEDPSLNQTVISDPRRIRQVLTNLYSNAIKYTEQGHITFEGHVSPDKRELVLSVSDTGAGIDEQDREAIFQPFKRLPSSPDAKGHGLGLAVVRHIVEVLKGSIALESKLGQGSKFTVTIPVEPETLEQPTQHLDTTPKRILVVEDQVMLRRAVVDLLKRAGWTVTSAPDLKSSLPLMNQARYEFVLTDFNLPDGNGIAVARAAKVLNPDCTTVLLTANTIASGDLPEGLFTAVIIKGSGPDQIVEQLELLRRKRAPRLTP